MTKATYRRKGLFGGIGGKAASRHGRRNRMLSAPMRLWNLKGLPRQYASSIKATLFRPSQTVPPTGDQGFQHMSLWKTFTFKPPQHCHWKMKTWSKLKLYCFCFRYNFAFCPKTCSKTSSALWRDYHRGKEVQVHFTGAEMSMICLSDMWVYRLLLVYLLLSLGIYKIMLLTLQFYYLELSGIVAWYCTQILSLKNPI